MHSVKSMEGTPTTTAVIRTENKTVQTNYREKLKDPFTNQKQTDKEVIFSGNVSAVTEKSKNIPSLKQSKFRPSPFPKPIIKKEANTMQIKEPSGVIGTLDMIGMESDPDSEADLYRKLSKKDVSVDSELPDESIISPEDEDYDFKVHFVHHGKKEDKMEQRSELLFQINELQEAVVAMKSSLKDAMTNLSMSDGNHSAVTDLEELRKKCEGNAAEILKMVLSLKTDFSSLKNDVVSISKRQEILQSSLRLLLEDRQLMSNDISQPGMISNDTRSRLDSSNSFIGAGETGGGQSESGSHSNDSGVALPVEKSSNSPSNSLNDAQFSGPRISDQDSLPDHPSLLVPPSVYDYVAGLFDSSTPYTSPNYAGNYLEREESFLHHRDDQGPYGKQKNSKIYYGRQSENGGTVYDSDSSLMMGTNCEYGSRNRSNGDFIKHDTYSSVTPSRSYNDLLADEHPPKVQSRGHIRESRGRSMSKERGSFSQVRKKRPLLGVTSAKIYQSTNHSHPTSTDRESRSGYRYSQKSESKEAQRYKIARELLETEKQYCRTLWTLQDTFAEPLKKEGILSNKDLSTLFPEEVYQLYEKHCLLQHQLRERLASWKWQPLIGDILNRFIDPHQCEVLRLYTKYVNDFPEVLKTFHRLCHSSQPFNDFVNKSLDQRNCRGMDLGAFLLSPVQRVPKYILILKYLLKYTEASHPDYRSIYTVLERLRDFLEKLNDAVEHSFRLVNSSVAPSNRKHSPPVGLTVLPPNEKYGVVKRENTKANSSYGSNSEDIYRSPKRSTSNASGALTPSGTKPLLSVAPSRSASLPRGFTSVPPDSLSSTEATQQSIEESRAPTRCGFVRSPSREASPYHINPKYSTLAPARSVTNISNGADLSLKRWDELTSSEPSLLESKTPASQSDTKPAIQNKPTISTANTHKLVTWTDSVVISEEAKSKKKGTIKSSLKNMFSFKKRPGEEQKCDEDPLYWKSPVQSNTRQNHQSSTIYESTKSVPPHKSSQVPSFERHLPVGDFLDEDGNPCSNV